MNELVKPWLDNIHPTLYKSTLDELRGEIERLEAVIESLEADLAIAQGNTDAAIEDYNEVLKNWSYDSDVDVYMKHTSQALKELDK